METFGALLRTTRERRGLAAGDVARAVGKSPSWLSDWERDKKAGAMPPWELNRLARALDLPVADLLRAAGYELGPAAGEPDALAPRERDLLAVTRPMPDDLFIDLIAIAQNLARAARRTPWPVPDPSLRSS